MHLGLRCCVSLLVSVFCFVATAEDFRPSSQYLVLVNGAKADPKTAEGRRVTSLTYEQLTKTEVPKDALSRTLLSNLLSEIASQRVEKEPFAIQLATNARGGITESSLIVKGTALVISGEDEAPRPTVAAAPAPAPMPARPETPPTRPAPMPAPAQDDGPLTTFRVVANRNLTGEEKEHRTIIHVPRNRTQLEATKFEDEARQRLHSQVMEFLTSRSLLDQEFTIEWEETRGPRVGLGRVVGSVRIGYTERGVARVFNIDSGAVAVRPAVATAPMPMQPAPARVADQVAAAVPAPDRRPAAKPDADKVSFKILVNQKGDPAEIKTAAANGMRIHEITAEQMRASNYPEPERQRLHEYVMERIADLNLANRPFSIEWTEDTKRVVHGNIIVRSEGSEHTIRNIIAEPLQDPDADLAEKEPVTLDALTKMVAAKSAPEEILPQLISWVSTSPLDAVNCKAAGDRWTFATEPMSQLFTAAGLKNPEALKDAGIRAQIEATAANLDRQGRLTIFTLARTEGVCLQSVAKIVWDRIAATRSDALVWDFNRVLTEVHGERRALTYDGERHIHRVAENRPDLKNKIEFVTEILLSPRSAELRFLPTKFRQWATTDTNTDGEDTRKEPIDILSYWIASHRYANITTETTVDDVERIRIVVAAIQHMLAPENHRVPEIFLGKSAQGRDADPARQSLTIYCPGTTLTLTSHQREFEVVRDGLLSSVRIPRARLAQMRRDAPFTFSCGSVASSLHAEFEPLKITLENPSSHVYRVGEDRKIKAVTTFMIVNGASPVFLAAVRAGTALKGYKAVYDEPVKDFKAEFFEEMKDADFYFPAGHHTNEARFQIGYEGSTKLRLQNEANGVIKELVAFVPPSTLNQNQAAQATMITVDELSALFKTRREMETRRRLTVENLACGSVGCVPAWMRAYKMSLPPDATPESLRALEGDVPIVIGAGRSFATEQAGLLDHGKYPFTALEIGAKEGSYTDLREFLVKTQFQPVSNIDKPEFFEAAGKNPVFTITVNRQGSHPVILTY